MDVSTAKVVAMLSLGLGSFVAGMLPACISQGARQKCPLLISCLLCFGAGVLLSTSLVHMLPESREKYPQYSELMLCAGFFLVYIVDEIVHFFYGTNEHGGDLVRGLGATDGEMSHRSNEHMRNRRSYGTGEETSLLARGLGPADGEMSQHCRGEIDNPRMCHVSHREPCNRSSSGIIGLLCALFVHSLLEGLAIGLQETSSQYVPAITSTALPQIDRAIRSSTTYYFIRGNMYFSMSERGLLTELMMQVLLLLGAVASHKYVVGFCLGAELCAGGASRLCAHLVCIALFSGGSVAGIGVGAALDGAGSVKDSAAVPIMQALAAGTLLYVTVSEVLPRERARWHGRRRGAGLVQVLAVASGFGLMYLTTMYLDHDAA